MKFKDTFGNRLIFGTSIVLGIISFIFLMCALGNFEGKKLGNIILASNGNKIEVEEGRPLPTFRPDYLHIVSDSSDVRLVNHSWFTCHIEKDGLCTPRKGSQVYGVECATDPKVYNGYENCNVDPQKVADTILGRKAKVTYYFQFYPGNTYTEMYVVYE
jgi:hypothetical protein